MSAPIQLEHHKGPRLRRLGRALAQLLIFLLAPNCDLSRRNTTKDKT